MKKITREVWIAIALFALLVAVTVIAAALQAGGEAGEAEAPLSSFSSAPNGARALLLWLGEVGYEASNELVSAFPPKETSLILMLEPFTGITEEEWTALDDWIESGGTLLLAGDGTGAVQAAEHYGFNLFPMWDTVPTFTVQTPLWTSPPLTGTVYSPDQAFYRTEQGGFVAHLARGDDLVVVSRRMGKGWLILSATSFPFSNAGLKEAGNAAMVLNLVALAGRGGRVWFDEWHHGRRLESTAACPSSGGDTPGEGGGGAGGGGAPGGGSGAGCAEEVAPAGPWAWLGTTPSGQALLLAAGLVFLALVLRGRRFGRPVPPPRETPRRTPLEYVTAMANLSRRAGHRRAVLHDYHLRLKRELGRRFRLEATLPDDEYVARLSACDPSLDAAALRRLLSRLQRRLVGEREMVQLAAEVARWMGDEKALS